MAHDAESAVTTEQDALGKLRDLIKDIRVAMVITTDDQGELHTRPMYAQQAETDGDLWFATSTSSSLVRELRDNMRILATFSEPDDQRYVVVRGEGFVNHDQAKIEELWNPGMKAWFPAGPADPDIALVRVEAHRAEYWDSPSAPVRWVQFVAALATGSRPKGGTHEELSLRTSNATSAQGSE